VARYPTGPRTTVEPELSPDAAARTSGLRTGWTTGTCASAAAKAAVLGLVGGRRPDDVEVGLPGGQRVTFHGKPGDIWYIFILNALLGYVGYIHSGLQLLVLPLSLFFLLIILRWFLQNLAWEGQATTLTFTGGYWPMLGWYLLLIVSIISIIGWAWVYTAWIRWMCRHVEGSARQLIFTAGGWSLLWRFTVFTLSCIVIIPIPWTFHWIARWFISQLALVERA